jgi:phosphatidylinositol alpha-1,6-mannosyltransferase
MKLLLLTNDFAPKIGGISTYLQGLVSHLHSPVLPVTPNLGGAVREPQRVVDRPFLWPNTSTLEAVRESARAFGPTAVVLGSVTPLLLLGSRIRAELKLPYFVIVHGAELMIPAAFPWLRGRIRRALDQAAGVFAVSAYGAGILRSIAPKAKLTVLGAGAPSTGEDRGIRSPPRAEPHTPVVIGAVGRFVPRKGWDRLLDAAESLHDEGRALRVVLVGWGRLESHLRRRARRARFPVELVVRPDDAGLAALYREFDIFALPAGRRWFGLEQEGLGLVYLEAASAGLPIVVGDSGGARETLLDGRTGFLVGSQQALRSALARLVDDPLLRYRFGQEGRRFVRSRFSWPAVAARADEAIAQATGATASRAERCTAMIDAS